jgi:hypothetical protein
VTSDTAPAVQSLKYPPRSVGCLLLNLNSRPSQEEAASKPTRQAVRESFVLMLVSLSSSGSSPNRLGSPTPRTIRTEFSSGLGVRGEYGLNPAKFLGGKYLIKIADRKIETGSSTRKLIFHRQKKRCGWRSSFGWDCTVVSKVPGLLGALKWRMKSGPLSREGPKSSKGKVGTQKRIGIFVLMVVGIYDRI